MLKSDEFDERLEKLINVAKEVGLCNEGDGFPIPTKYKLEKEAKLQIDAYLIELNGDKIKIEREKTTLQYEGFNAIVFFRNGLLVDYNNNHYNVKFEETPSEGPQFAIIRKGERFYLARFKS